MWLSYACACIVRNLRTMNATFSINSSPGLLVYSLRSAVKGGQLMETTNG